MDKVGSYKCFKCKKLFLSYLTLIKHLKSSYQYLEKYYCNQENCNRSFNCLGSLKKHYRYDHLNVLTKSSFKTLVPTNYLQKACLNEQSTSTQSQNSNALDNMEFVADVNNEEPAVNSKKSVSESVTEVDISDFITKYISRFYNIPSLPRNVVQTIIDNSQELIGDIYTAIFNKLSLTVDQQIEKTRDVFFQISKSFDKLKSEHLRLKYFQNSKTFLRPESFYIGSRTMLGQISSTAPPELSVKKVEGKKIDIKMKLKLFLELPNVLNVILRYIEEENSQTILSSLYQGSLWKKIKSKLGSKTVFPIYLFYDDFEPCNALGSRAGLYKIGAVYISLACIPPKYASSLDNIFLAQLFYSNDRSSYGNRKVFSSLINDLLLLETEGIAVTTENGTSQIYATLFLILGDNLGLNSILGFNESFSSDYFCRICRSPKERTRIESVENSLSLRSIDNYKLDSLTLSHGVKEVCIWHDLSNFHVTTNISVDLMHDLLEGILRYDMALLINNLIEKKYFTLGRLNERIKFFKFSKCDIGNPMPQIKLTHLKNKCIIISASEMLSLSSYFGVLVGDLVPQEEPTWRFYVLIIEIMDILLSRQYTKEKIDYLNVLIQEHHNMFSEIFNETLKPKYHLLLHYPNIIHSIGLQEISGV